MSDILVRIPIELHQRVTEYGDRKGWTMERTMEWFAELASAALQRAEADERRAALVRVAVALVESSPLSDHPHTPAITAGVQVALERGASKDALALVLAASPPNASAEDVLRWLSAL